MPNLTLVSAVDTFLASADQAGMRTNLGLGTMATQAASAVAITGGTFAGTSVQAGSGSGRSSINHDINGVYLGLTTSTIQFCDTNLSRGGAAHVLMMGVTSATPSAQCFKGPNGSGTNIVGGKLSIAPGQSTGYAEPAPLVLQSTASGAPSATTAQALVDVFSILNSEYISIGSGVIIDGSGAGFRLGSTGGSLLGLWGAAPVPQFATSGGAAISNIGGGTTVHDDSTFVGSTGSTAYTINDIISALKLSGVIAQ